MLAMTLGTRSLAIDASWRSAQAVCIPSSADFEYCVAPATNEEALMAACNAPGSF